MINLSVHESALKRRSVKAFKSDPIPQDILDKIIEATIAAPSSWNFQPTRIIMLESPEQKQALADVAWGQKQITQAPVVFVFAADVRGWETNMDQIINQAVELGAWPEKVGSFIRDNAPGFQSGLAEKEREYAIKDAMISATHAALAAESFGLGTCYMNGWDEEGVKKVIDAEGEEDIAIALVLPCGYADETPKFPGRLSKDQVVFTDRLT